MSEPKLGAFRVQSVAVIGAGIAGRAFALRCARAGLDVVLEDVMPSKLRRAEDEYAEHADAAGRFRYANTVEDAVAQADFAIDFVPDELESKLEIFCLLDRMAPPRTVLCTPTETLSITDLASCTYRPDRCVGVRWPNDASVQLAESRFLSAFAREATVEFFRRLAFATDVLPDSSETMLTKHAG